MKGNIRIKILGIITHLCSHINKTVLLNHNWSKCTMGSYIPIFLDVIVILHKSRINPASRTMEEPDKYTTLKQKCVYVCSKVVLSDMGQVLCWVCVFGLWHYSVRLGLFWRYIKHPCTTFAIEPQKPLWARNRLVLFGWMLPAVRLFWHYVVCVHGTYQILSGNFHESIVICWCEEPAAWKRDWRISITFASFQPTWRRWLCEKTHRSKFTSSVSYAII